MSTKKPLKVREGRHPVTGIPLRLMLALAVTQRRWTLNLSAERAAALAGLNVGQWLAMEAASWVPEEHAVVRAIADTLEIGYMELSLVAEVSRHWVAETKN